MIIRNFMALWVGWGAKRRGASVFEYTISMDVLYYSIIQ